MKSAAKIANSKCWRLKTDLPAVSIAEPSLTVSPSTSALLSKPNYNGLHHGRQRPFQEYQRYLWSPHWRRRAREVGATLHRLHRDTHLVCRYGGEEFCVLLPGYTLEDAAEAAEKIRLAIMDIRLEEPAELRLTASLGVTELQFGATDPQGMINQADTCLYIAKRQGRNQVVCYDPSMAEVEMTIPRSSESSLAAKLSSRWKTSS